MYKYGIYAIHTTEEQTLAYVYWIRTEGMTDTGDGYVGVTSKDPETRLQQHNKKGRFCKYGSKEELRIDVLFEGAVDECFREEKRLRPTERIGWNIAPGGEGGAKGNHYVTQNGMPWAKKLHEARNKALAEGKIKVIHPNKKSGANLRRRAPWRYTIIDKYTNETHVVHGREGIAELIGSAIKGTKMNRFLKGLNEQYELLAKQPLAVKE